MSTSFTQHGLICPTCGGETECNLAYHASNDPYAEDSVTIVLSEASDDNNCCQCRRDNARNAVIRNLQLDAA